MRGMRKYLALFTAMILLLLVTIGGIACSKEEGKSTKEQSVKEIEAKDLAFTTFSTDVRIIGVASDGDFVRMKDGRVILRKGMLYKVAENTVELMSANYADASDLTIIEYVDPDNITLSYVLTPENTADNVVRYYCEDPNVTIDADGNVRFAVLDERAVRIIARTENGVAAVVVLKWNKPQEAIPMS